MNEAKRFEEIIKGQKPESIEYSTKCMGCPRVQQSIQDIIALREVQQEHIDIASLVMDETEKDKMARELATLYVQSQGLSIEDLEEIVEAIKQDYPREIDIILACLGDEEKAIRDDLAENTNRCKNGPHKIIAFDSEGEITASGDICGLDIPKNSERIVSAVIYPEVQLDTN